MLRRRLRLRTILAMLVLATTVPLAAFAARLIWTMWQQQKDHIGRQNVEQARAVSVAVDQQIGRTVTALEVLASLRAMDAPTVAEFTDIARGLVPDNPGWTSVRLLDPAMTVLASVPPIPEGTTTSPEPEWARAVIATRAPAVSTLTRSTDGGQWGVTIGVPILRNDRVKYVLGARVSAVAFSDVLARQKVPGDGVLTLLDTTPIIIARTRNEDTFAGGPPAADFLERLRSGPEGSWYTKLLEGTPSYAAWSRSPVTGWTIGIGLPAETVDRPTRNSLIALSAAGLWIVGGGITLALLLSRGIVRAQEAAATAARALARGESVVPFHSSIAEAHELSLGLREAATILQTRMRERDDAQREADRHRATTLEREQAARRAAESLSRAKDEFVATLSHELRTPLNAIFGWVALMKTGTLDPARYAHALDVIERNTRAQTQLIEDLLDMSRMIRGTVRLDMRPVDLAAVLEAAVDSLRPTADARQIPMTIVDARHGLLVSADHSRLQQVLWNLLANSLKFTPSGGHIDAWIEVDGRDAVVRVRDTGEGIDPEFLAHVFDRFRQESADMTRAHSGLGIGLSLVRHLTELHGGSVDVQSAGKGKGATFSVRLPLLGARATTPAALSVAAPLPDAGARVLVGLHLLAVDDDPDGLDLIATALRHAGARVTTAPSAGEALAVLANEHVDLIVSDVAMPNGSGYDLVRSLRGHPRTSTLPVLALTAYNRSEDRDRALAEGFDAHLGKPFDPRVLVGLIAGLARPT